MLQFNDKHHRVPSPMPDRLKTAGIGLGLARLQMDIGLREDAKATLAFLQDDFQALIHGVETSSDIAPPQCDGEMYGTRTPRNQESWNLDEEFVAVHA